MRCINVMPLKQLEGDRPYQQHYNALFDAVGLNKNERIMWGIGKCHDELSKGTNLGFYGVPIDGEVIIRVIELDDSKKNRFHAHNYYDWSDYLFFSEDNDIPNIDVSIALLKCYTGNADVEQVIFHEDAIKIMKCYSTTNCVELWRKLHKKYIVDNEPFEQREEESIQCCTVNWKTTP